MRRRTLGATDLNVSEQCLGTMYFGTRLDHPRATAILDRFVEAGGTFVDTANNYAFWEPDGAGGESETLLGRWLRERGERDRLQIATKAGAMPMDPATGFASAEGLSGRAIERAIDGSLRRLGTDYVDLYYAHVDDRSVPLEETMGAFARLIEAGKVRTIGCSNVATWRIAESRGAAAAGGPPYAAAQFRYTYLRPKPGSDLDVQVAVDDQLRDYCLARNTTLLAYSPLLQGAYSRDGAALPPEYAGPDSDARLRALRDVAGRSGVPANQVVLAWLRQQEPSIIPVISASRTEQLDENIGSLGVTLDDDQMSRLSAAGA